MNYEEKYNIALANAEAYHNITTNTEVKNWLEYAFPELKESEDERIRKGIIKSINDLNTEWLELHGVTKEDALAWLEEQGEQKPTDKVEPKFKVGDWVVCCNYEPEQIIGIRNHMYEMSNGDIRPINMINNNHNIRLWTIQDAKDGDVLATDTWTFIFKKYQNKSVYYHCAISTFNNFSISNTGEFDSNYVHPATKEQRDLLFSKMKEAGYEWDSEKKELRKIEQKPTWSEEDEKLLTSTIEYLSEFREVYQNGAQECIAWLKSLKERVQPVQEWSEKDEGLKNCFIATLCEEKHGGREENDRFVCWLDSLKQKIQPQPKQKWSEYDKIQLSEAIQMIEANGTWIRSEDAVKKVSNWLKSLKPNHWKPSEEQMSMLSAVLNDSNNITAESVHIVLKSLYDDLKKL